MTIAENFLMEIEHEGPGTRKVLAAIAEEHFAWQSHEKAFTMKDLAIHTTKIFGWFNSTLNQEEIDLDNFEDSSPEVNTTADLLELFDHNFADATQQLQGYPDEKMHQTWRMRHGDQVMFELPRVAVVRASLLNHLYHHRGQLSTYLRAVGARVPAVLGPTADEQ